MKECPNCGEIIGDGVKECFKCHYNYSYGRVITPEEKSNERIDLENKMQKEHELRKNAEEEKQEQLKNNPLYEYKTVILNDRENGTIDEVGIKNNLNHYAADGWRLHTVFTNEVGKNSTTTMVGPIGGGINATINQTILIFERCIKR